MSNLELTPEDIQKHSQSLKESVANLTFNPLSNVEMGYSNSHSVSNLINSVSAITTAIEKFLPAVSKDSALLEKIAGEYAAADQRFSQNMTKGVSDSG